MSSSLGLWRQANQIEGFQTTLTDLQAQAKTALADFFPLWNKIPTHLRNTDISNSVMTTWKDYVDPTLVSSQFAKTLFNNLLSELRTSISVRFTYSNTTFSTSTTFSNMKIRNKIDNAEYDVFFDVNKTEGSKNFAVNPRYINSYSCSKGTYSSGLLRCVIYQNDPRVSRVLVYPRNPESRNPPLPANDRWTTYEWVASSEATNPSPNYQNGSGTITVTIHFNSLIVPTTLSFSVTNITTTNPQDITEFYTLENMRNTFKTWLNCVYVDLYTNVITIHSENLVLFEAPFSPAVNTTLDRQNIINNTNVDEIVRKYKNEYLPELYKKLRTHMLLFVNRLDSLTREVPPSSVPSMPNLQTDKTSVESTPAIPETESSLIDNIILLNRVYRTYRSSFLSMMRVVAQSTLLAFYNDTVIPHRRFLFNSDISVRIRNSITESTNYFTFSSTGPASRPAFDTLTAGVTYTSINNNFTLALRDIVSALLTRLNAMYTTWKGYGMTAPTTPNDFDAYATSGWSADNDLVLNATTTMADVVRIRNKICATGAYWPALVAAMQTFTTPRLTMLQNMYTWATQPIPRSGTNISANALGTHVATVGLGVVAPPLLFTQPIVATTTVAGVRTFYGIVVNNGLAVSNTLLTTLGFETTFVNDSTSVTTTTEHRLTNTVASGNFEATINLSSLSIPVGTTVTLKTFGSNTANQKVYGNAITFVY